MPRSLIYFPLGYLLVDLFLRYQLLDLYSASQLLIYTASILVSIGFYFFVLFTANIFKHHTYVKNGLLFFYAVFFVVAILGSYSFYVFNGFFPNYYTFEYFKNEPESAFVLIQDSIAWYEIVVILLGVLTLFTWWKNATGRHWVWNSRMLVLSMGSFLLLSFSGVVWQVKKYDQCFIVDVNFAADIQRHMVDYETHRSFKGKGLGRRTSHELSRHENVNQLNVLVVVFESLRNQNLQLYGYHRATTPNWVRFQRKHPKELFLFKKPYAVSSTTMLAVPAVLSGIAPYQDSSLLYEQPLIWSYGKSCGMKTFFLSSHTLKWYRFDRFYANEPLDYMWNKETSGKEFYNDMGVDDRHTIKALIQQMNRLGNQPFFGVVQFNGTHYPYKVEDSMKKWKGTFVDEYDNAIRYEDQLLQSLFSYLERSERLKNTVIVFTSDHGESLKDHNNIGHVDSYYREAISVPLVFYIPKEIQARLPMNAFTANRNKLTSTIDIAPTLIDILGLRDKTDVKNVYGNYSGYSLFANVPKNRSLITMNNNRIARFKVGISVINSTHHFIFRSNIVPNREELYVLKNDPKETKNAWKQYQKSTMNWIKRVVSSYPEAQHYLPASWK